MPHPVHPTNDQVVDALATTDALVTGLGPSASMAILDAVMAETIGLAMHNAVSRQQQSSLASSAAITAACARMLATSNSSGPHPPHPASPLAAGAPEEAP